MIRFLAKLVWDFSEFSGISLGRLAPRVFGLMVGCKGKRINRGKNGKI